MSLLNLLTRRPATLTAVFFIVVVLLLYSTSSSRHGPSPSGPASHPNRVPPSDKSELSYPSEYSTAPVEPQFCAERFGMAYLERLRDSATEYCTKDSPSALTCFHSKTAPDRTDTFCLGRNAIYDPESHKFRLGCELKDLGYSASTPSFNRFAGYWYETGPRVVFTRWVEMIKNAVDKPSSEPRSYTILVKREIEPNFWHSLMEIFSMTMSMDVLRFTPDPANRNQPLVAASDVANTRVVLLDDAPDGPLIELWDIIGNQPTVRLKDLPADDPALHENIIIPLPGGSNPLWQGEWTINPCEDSKLLRTFSHRVLDFYSLSTHQPRQGQNIKLIFIDRANQRRLVKSQEYIEEVKSAYPHVDVQSYDFTEMPLKRQLEIVQETDILVGVHGAGLSHSIFLSPRSAVVEILPPKLDHKGFRNVASLLDLSYFSTHGESALGQKRDWQKENVFLEKDKFMALVDSAVKSMYNRGERNYDAI